MCVFVVHQFIKIHISFVNFRFIFVKFRVSENKSYFLKLFKWQQNS